MAISLKRVTDYIQWHLTHWIRLDRAYQASLFELLALLAPQQATGVKKVRVGADRDGGYVMLDDFKGIETALSLGIGPDVSWDYAIAERGISVWQFDHTVSASPQAHALFHFEPKKIVVQNAGVGEVTLTSLLQQAAAKQILLKVDIEGDEWDLFSQIDPDLLSNCRQIVLEMHDFLSVKNPEWRDKAVKALTLLVRDFGVVHVHGNNLAKRIMLEDCCLPDSLEVIFANRRFYRLEPTEETFPGPYDRKNNRFFPDFHLGQFRFESSKKT